MTTFPVGEQTHRAVLPQQPALESVRADTRRSTDETAHGLPATAAGTGGEHGRGETGGHRVRPRRRHAESAAVAVETAEFGSGDAPTDHTYTGGVGASRVFVLARDGRPLMPCHPARARELLTNGRAVVHRRIPFTIRLKDRMRADSEVDGVQLRIDPGSKATGFALTDVKTEICDRGEAVLVRRGLVTAELRHRGDQIRLCMKRRAVYRSRRRSVNLRHRAPRSNNRSRPEGWLPPSLRHRVDTTLSLVNRFCRYAPVTEVHVEDVAFDTHSMSTGKQLRGAEHQNGRLAGTDARAYLVAAWGRACAYCGATGVPLNTDHIHPSSRGGSSRITNLVPACVPCNQAKGKTSVAEFLAHRPDRLAEILAQTRPPLRDAAVMNATRRQLIEALGLLGRPVRSWPGGRTQRNRTAMGLAKTHTIDALAVGDLDRENGGRIVRVPARVLVVKATGRGSYARTTPDRFGFPRLRRARTKQHFGYVTGDLVRATVPTGKWAGTWKGRITVRARGQHTLTSPTGRFGVSYRNLRLLQRGDGYAYDVRQEPVPQPSRKTG
ncbi:RNA-guided endonuclease IscB [Streptomyces sp. NPDC047525]|uniref:RNA-guided endonuclease IscB n=1 Tax=Streptomyces sp. NPDC047525 TaxID=3155264 RepID=UPI0033C73E61